jgi:hypothetical protein
VAKGFFLASSFFRIATLDEHASAPAKALEPCAKRVLPRSESGQVAQEKRPDQGKLPNIGEKGNRYIRDRAYPEQQLQKRSTRTASSLRI